jgi:hypothetical protein
MSTCGTNYVHLRDKLWPPVGHTMSTCHLWVTLVTLCPRTHNVQICQHMCNLCGHTVYAYVITCAERCPHLSHYVPTVGQNCVHPVDTLSPPWGHTVSTLGTHCVHPVSTLCTPCVHTVTHCVHTASTLGTHCVHPWDTLRPPLGHTASTLGTHCVHPRVTLRPP